MAIRRAGRLRHRLTIQRRSDGVYDELGHEANDWQTVGCVFAEVRDLAGRELERARQTVAEVSVSVTIRHFELLKPTDRFVFGKRVLNIGGIVDPENLKEEQIVLCVEQKMPCPNGE
jgi:SPP1 family predicted phage head-tail adaptor